MYRARRARKNVKYTYEEGDDVEEDMYASWKAAEGGAENSAAANDANEGDEAAASPAAAPHKKKKKGKKQKRREVAAQEGQEEVAEEGAGAAEGAAEEENAENGERNSKRRRASDAKKGKKGKKKREQQQLQSPAPAPVSSLAALAGPGSPVGSPAPSAASASPAASEQGAAPSPAGSAEPAARPAKASRKVKRKKAKKARSPSPSPSPAPAAEPAAVALDFEAHLAELAQLRAATERLMAGETAAQDKARAAAEAAEEERQAREAYVAELEAQLEALRAGRSARSLAEDEARTAELEALRRDKAKLEKENDFFKGEIKALHTKVRGLEKDCERLDEVDDLRRQVEVYQMLTATRVEASERAPEAEEAQGEARAPPAAGQTFAHCKSVHRRYARVVEYDLTLRDDEVDYNPTRLDVEQGVDVPDFLAEPISFAPHDASIFFKNLAVMLQRQPAAPGSPSSSEAGEDE